MLHLLRLSWSCLGLRGRSGWGGRTKEGLVYSWPDFWGRHRSLNRTKSGGGASAKEKIAIPSRDSV